MGIRAIILGATGMVGEGVLHEALLHPDVEAVLVLSRKPTGVTHPKMKELLHNDFQNLTPIAGQLAGYTACFFCLGVTSLGKKEDEYRRTTYDLTMHVAQVLSGLNPSMTFCYVSGSGTDSTEEGKLMWARVKGKTENDLKKLPFKAVYLFRPGYIKPIKGLKHAIKPSALIAPLYPFLRAVAGKYVCTLEEVGRAMIRVSTEGYKQAILECADIQEAGK